MTIEELQVLITANTKQLQSEINKANKSIDSLKKSADKSQSGVMSAFNKLKSGIIALGIGKVIKDSIMSGMNAIESDSLFDTSLGNMADSVRNWSNEVSEALGLDAVAMRKNTGVIYNMTTSMGLAEQNALKMSQGISLLTEDMASFYNLDGTEAFNKLRAGLTGETEPLKALGILVDENTIKQVAYQHGIASTGAELTQQQKVLARYVAILQQTGNAQGDLARTINSPANQLRLLKNQVVQLGRSFANILMPVVSAVLPYLTALAKVTTLALNSLARFLGISTGSGSGVSGMGSDIGDMSSGLGGVSNALGDVEDSIGKASNGVGDVNDGLNSATKNAKKLKGALAGFDEMTVLTEKDTSSTGATGGTGGGSGLGGNLSDSTLGAIGGVGSDGLFQLGDYDSQLDGVASKVDEIVNKIKKAFKKFTGGINFNNLIKAFNNLKTSLAPLGSTIWNGLKWAWENVLKPLGQWVIGDWLPAWLNNLAGTLDFINPILKDSQALGQWLWDKFLKPIAEWTGGIIVDILNGIGDALSWIGQNQVAVAILEGLAISIGLVSGALGLWNVAVALWNSIGVIATGVTSAFGVAMGILTSPITLIIGAIALLVAGIILLVKNWDTVKETAKNVWDKVKEIWGVVADWFTSKVIDPLKEMWGKISSWFNEKVIIPIKNVFSPIVDWFKKLFGSIWESMKSTFEVMGGIAKGCWEIITHVWGIASSWFNDKIISPIKNFFGNMWDTISGAGKKAWDKLKEGGKNAWEGIKSVFSPVVNWFSEKFSNAWSSVKKVFSAGGKIFDGIKDGIANAFKTVVNAIIKGINKVISLPFNTINGFLNKIRNAEFLGIAPFKDKWKQNPLSVPQIPLLARGGVVDAPTVAMIGEAGKEAVMPLERNTGWIDQLADKLNDKSGNGQPIQVIVQLGDETIFDKFIDYTKEKSFETNGEVFSL